jgi:hypothetical protein
MITPPVISTAMPEMRTKDSGLGMSFSIVIAAVTRVITPSSLSDFEFGFSGGILLPPSCAIGKLFSLSHHSFHGRLGAMARRFSARSTALVHFHLAEVRFLSVNIRLRL